MKVCVISYIKAKDFFHLFSFWIIPWAANKKTRVYFLFDILKNVCYHKHTERP